MGWSPSRKLMDAIGKSFWKHAMLPSATKPAATKNHTSQALELAAGVCAGSLSHALLITH